MVVRRKVRQWKREKVANGMRETVEEVMRCTGQPASCSRAPLQAQIRTHSKTCSTFHPLTVNRLCNRPINHQDCILHIIIHQSSLKVSSIELRDSLSIENDDRIGEESTGVCSCGFVESKTDRRDRGWIKVERESQRVDDESTEEEASS